MTAATILSPARLGRPNTLPADLVAVGGMGEDDKFRLKTDMQKLIDDGNKKLDEMAAKKEADIRM